MIKAEPIFSKHFLAVASVEKLLQSISAALDEAGVPYCVIGGNAVAAWVASVDDGAVRATKDVDLLIRRDDLARAKVAAEKIDLVYQEVSGVPMFLMQSNPNPRTGVHLVYANERVREYCRHSAPDVTDSWRSTDGYCVLNLKPLVAMKLQANRLVDQLHIEDMLKLGLISESIEHSLSDELRNRLDIIRTSGQHD